LGADYGRSQTRIYQRRLLHARGRAAALAAGDPAADAQAGAAPGAGAAAAGGAEDGLLQGAPVGDPVAAYARAAAAAAAGLGMPLAAPTLPPPAPSLPAGVPPTLELGGRPLAAPDLPGGAPPAPGLAVGVHGSLLTAPALPREAGGAGDLLQEAATWPGAAFPAPPPPTSRSAVIAALVAAWAAAAEGMAHVREAAIAWEHERDAADALAGQIIDAELLLGLPASPDVGATSSGSAGPRVSHTVVIWHDPADPLVTQLQYQAGGVQNIRLLVSVVLEPESPSYARWRDLVLLTLRCYALDDHVLRDTVGVAQTVSWLRLDSIVLSWILGTISLDLHDLVRSTPTARGAWLALEGQFLGNAEARSLCLDASSGRSSRATSPSASSAAT